MSRRSNNTTMQSEIFIVLMIVMVLLFIITAFYISKLKQHQQPPLIVLDEAHGYSFSSSSALMNDTFKAQLQTTVAQTILDYATTYRCDIVEVYGYTDGEPFSTHYSSKQSFDNALHHCLIEPCDIQMIQPSSNLELGMQRAVSVVTALTPKLRLPKSPIQTIRPYSGGGFIDEKGEIANIEDKQRNRHRRRIEIRLSRSWDLNQRR